MKTYWYVTVVYWVKENGAYSKVDFYSGTVESETEFCPIQKIRQIVSETSAMELKDYSIISPFRISSADYPDSPSLKDVFSEDDLSM